MFFKYSVKRYGLGLSNELLCIMIAQGAAKLWPFKVEGWRKILAWAFSNPWSLSKSLGTQNFSFPPTLTGHSFAALWAMMMKSSSYESPKPYLLTLNLKNSISALLTSVKTCWKVPIYYINGVLVILIWTALYFPRLGILQVIFSVIIIRCTVQNNTRVFTINRIFIIYYIATSNCYQLIQFFCLLKLKM